MEQKKILILCDAFGPPSYGPRVRFLCDYLVASGWFVQLISEKMQGTDAIPFKEKVNVIELPYYKKQGFAGKLEWIFKFFLGLLFDHKNRWFFRQIKRCVSQTEYDLLFCSTFHTFPLPAAARLAKWKNIPLVTDCRDIAEQCPGGEYNAHSIKNWIGTKITDLHRHININRRNTVLNQSAAVSSVSTWHVNFLKNIAVNVQPIYNGYDADVFYPKNTCEDKFDIIYTGRIYGKTLQDPCLFFEALSHLNIETKIELKDCKVKWYVNEKTKLIIEQYAQKYEIEQLMEYHNYVPMQEVPNLLHRSSIVLVLSNKSTEDGPHGIMTTKFFEALGVEKPVLCVRSDEDCLAAAIKETKAGIAATNVDEVKDFILEKYAEWKQNGFTRQVVNQDAKKKFSRQEQAKQFVEIFEKVIEK